VAEIETDIRLHGQTDVPGEIAVKCKQGLDRCEETNPQGSCCLRNGSGPKGNIGGMGRSAGYGNRLDWADFDVLLREKCAVRSVTFESTEDFLSRRILDHVERIRGQQLGPLVPKLPSFEIVISELRPRITALIP